MSETLYRLKPVDWLEMPSGRVISARDVFPLELLPLPGGQYMFRTTGYVSLAMAKKAAENWRRARLLSVLEPVES